MCALLWADGYSFREKCTWVWVVSGVLLKIYGLLKGVPRCFEGFWFAFSGDLLFS